MLRSFFCLLLNLPWFFIFVWLFIFVGNQMWLGAIKIESQSCINNFLCQNKSIVDLENGFTHTIFRFIYNLPRSFNSMMNIQWNILNHEQSHRNVVIWTYNYANLGMCPMPNNAFFCKWKPFRNNSYVFPKCTKIKQV